jgi:hypothetical protein
MPFDRLHQNLPLSFIELLTQYHDEAFATAWLTAKKTVAEPEVLMASAQLRHALCEDAFRRAATNTGIEANWSKTLPRGGQFSLARAADVVIVRSNVQHHLGTPRPSKFRRVFAAANEWLDPPHPSMFEPPKLLSDASMCAMVISTIEPRVDPSVPAFLGIGVPSPDLRRWIFRRSMTELIAMYRDRSAPEEKVPEVSVRDLAMPKLKE